MARPQDRLSLTPWLRRGPMLASRRPKPRFQQAGIPAILACCRSVSLAFVSDYPIVGLRGARPGRQGATCLNFNIIYDTSVNSAPAAFKTAITAVVQFFQTTFTNPITVTIDVGYGEVNGQALPSNALGASRTFFYSSTYTQIQNALAQHATSADQISAANS